MSNNTKSTVDNESSNASVSPINTTTDVYGVDVGNSPNDDSRFVTKRFGDLKSGDVLVGSDGDVEVKTAYDSHIPERMYALELENGSVIEASGNHMWYIEPQEDVWQHADRVKNSKKLLKSDIEWIDEAVVMAESDIPYEIGMEDLFNFFDFIENETERSFLLFRIADSLGHIVEENITYEDHIFKERTPPQMEKVYDARRFFQQALALTNRKWRKKWPVIVGRVVTTDDLFHHYPDTDIPTVKNK